MLILKINIGFKMVPQLRNLCSTSDENIKKQEVFLKKLPLSPIN